MNETVRDECIKTGASLIAEERLRQFNEENYTDSKDDYYWQRELAIAALCYLRRVIYGGIKCPKVWPWPRNAWNPKSKIRDLVRAGALIAAEIDRLQREAAHSDRTGE